MKDAPVIGQPLATLAVDAANFSMTWQYTSFALSMGPSQPVINDRNEIIGTTPQWAVTAQWSPQAIVQLHGLLGHLLQQYERQFGPIPRPAVLFETRSAAKAPGEPAEDGSNVYTMSGATVEPGAVQPMRPGDPPPVLQRVDIAEGDTCKDCGKVGPHYHRVAQPTVSLYAEGSAKRCNCGRPNGIDHDPTCPLY